jgi:sterol 3beta-glucosyltransferase
MRIFLLTAGSRGDVEPFAALAEQALAAGHQVRLVAPENSGVQMGGLDVVSMGVDYTRMIQQQGVSVAAALRNYRSVVRPVMRGVIVGSARAALEYEPDLIVYHPKVLSAPLVADALGVPHVAVETVPSLTPTRAFPAPGTVPRGLGPLNRLTYRGAAVASVMFRSELDEVRAMLGVGTRTSSAPTVTLMPISPAILSRPPDWPDSVHLTGPWIRAHEPAALQPEVTEFITEGSFVYAGFGSMAAGDATGRGRAIIDAVRAHGARCLVATGLGGIDVPPDRRARDVLVVRAVPHALVLPQAIAAVHHGGIGTIHAAMAAATPSVIVPFIADQPFWASRLHEAGLTPAPIPPRALTTLRLHTALDTAEQGRSRTVDVAHAMSAEAGTRTALTLLASIR